MLSSVPIGWLWFMVVTATVINCLAMAIWIPSRQFRIKYPFGIVVCTIATIVFSVRVDGFAVANMLILCSFGLVGLTIGCFPTRKRFTIWAHELNQGVKRKKYDYPRSHITFLCACVVIMGFVAALLTS